MKKRICLKKKNKKGRQTCLNTPTDENSTCSEKSLEFEETCIAEPDMKDHQQSKDKIGINTETNIQIKPIGNDK